jgi:hypothetical protein
MNDDIEKLLGNACLAPPSAGLDRRMNELWAAGATGQPAARRSRWWWLALPAAGTIAASLFLLSRQTIASAPIQPVLYQIEAKGQMREWLLNPASESLPPPKMIVSVQQ